MRVIPFVGFCLCQGVVTTGLALEPQLPQGASETFQSVERMDTASNALAPFEAGQIRFEKVDGTVRRRVWRVMQPGIPTLELLAAIRAQIGAEGYSIAFECDTDDCGGFDFRFAIDVVPEPEMHVDLGDFRYLSAFRGEAQSREGLNLLVSRDSASSFVQLVEVASPSAPVPAPQAVQDGPAPTTLGSRLQAQGFAALDGVEFATGSVEIAGEPAVLSELAEWLKANPGRTVTLVGHTDAQGSLAANEAVSARRARAIRDRLVSRYGIAAGRLDARGAGYLAPRSSNLTAEGRRANRRVEVILDQTE